MFAPLVNGLIFLRNFLYFQKYCYYLRFEKKYLTNLKNCYKN